MKWIPKIILYLAGGVLLEQGGITSEHWQFYAIIICYVTGATL
jgi:hypothetical protein